MLSYKQFEKTRGAKMKKIAAFLISFFLGDPADVNAEKLAEVKKSREPWCDFLKPGRLTLLKRHCGRRMRHIQIFRGDCETHPTKDYVDELVCTCPQCMHHESAVAQAQDCC